MTKYYIKISLILIIVATCFLFSCQPAEKETELVLSSYNHSEQIHLFGNENYPAFNLDINFTIPNDSITYQGLYEAMSVTFFDSLYSSNNSPTTNLQHLADNLVLEYRELEKEIQLDSIDISGSYNWEMIKSNQVIFQGEIYISFSNEIFTFTGGAHGNTLRNYYVFDIGTTQLLNSEATFKQGSCEAIIELQKAAAKKSGLLLDDLYSNGFSCDRNFYITNEGFQFYYDQYEIASYADGPQIITVSFEEIQPHIKLKTPK